LAELTIDFFASRLNRQSQSVPRVLNRIKNVVHIRLQLINAFGDGLGLLRVVERIRSIRTRLDGRKFAVAEFLGTRLQPPQPREGCNHLLKSVHHCHHFPGCDAADLTSATPVRNSSSIFDEPSDIRMVKRLKTISAEVVLRRVR
jgi:hypothetical protein